MDTIDMKHDKYVFEDTARSLPFQWRTQLCEARGMMPCMPCHLSALYAEMSCQASQTLTSGISEFCAMIRAVLH